MYSFKNDYSEGAHPEILRALLETNLEQKDGYGEDSFCREAAALLRQAMKRDDVDIHFLAGGTQANLTAIGAFLRPHEAAMAAETGHILVHETGAIEATGHKVISIPSRDGKLTPGAIQAAVDLHTDEHMVKPALVYLSQSTEVGTIYSLAEMRAIAEVCHRNRLILFVDGARLGAALCAESSDLDLTALAQLADAFYIGGTKNGALIGEALVLANPDLKSDFRFHMKQRGALLAKGRLIGLQFRELFRDGLYERSARHANSMADVLRNGIQEMGFSFLTESPTNQVFPILPDALIARLQKDFSFHVWSRESASTSAIRFVTSWATPESAVQALLDAMRNG